MKKRWYEKYLPFVMQSPQMKFQWLCTVFAKRSLSVEEITPYIRLLLEDVKTDSEIDGLAEVGVSPLTSLFEGLDEVTIAYLLEAADIYDTPKIFRLINRPTPEHAVLALKKRPPLYEENPDRLIDHVFQVIHDRSEELLRTATGILEKSADAPPHFEPAHQRFQEKLKDESILSLLFPKARTDS